MNLSSRWLVLVAAIFIAALALWTGMLVAASRLTGRARTVGEGAAQADLAVALHRRWASPLLFVSLAMGFVWLAFGPADRLQAHWVYAIIAALMAIVALHAVVGDRARRVRHGSLRATRGEGLRRAALVVSFAAILVLAALRTTLVP
ncbi:MAG TPA: hypothetical protein VHV30_13855 [Polyangiaceae bacterium]|nr:hypothetical protein [Polyangiaceae bacterium]